MTPWITAGVPLDGLGVPFSDCGQVNRASGRRPVTNGHQQIERPERGFFALQEAAAPVLPIKGEVPDHSAEHTYPTAF